MYFLQPDLSAVTLAALIPLLFGSFWYSPALFGNHWLRLSGLEITDVKQARLAMIGAFLGGFAASFVMSLVLAVLIKNLFVVTPLDGMVVGFILWLGFIATTTLPEYLFSKQVKPYQLYLLVNGYHLISLVIMGGLLAVWLPV